MILNADESVRVPLGFVGDMLMTYSIMGDIKMFQNLGEQMRGEV